MDKQNETQSTGWSFSVNATSIHELRDILAEASDYITGWFDTANKAAHDHDQEQREKAFIRYCFTGRFE